MPRNNDHRKPFIETMINTAALTLTSRGVYLLSNCCDYGVPYYHGFLIIAAGALLEFFKYWGRKKKYW